MKKEKIYFYTGLLVLGIMLLLLGTFAISDSNKNVTGLCIGLGAGLVGMNIANLVIYRYYKKNPNLEKQSEVESKDERNILITNKAKAKAFDIMIRILMVLPFALILANSSLWVILAVIAIYLFAFGTQLYYMVKFGKEM